MASTIYWERLDVRKRSIRVFTILPGSWSSPIKCRLKQVPLEIDVEYHALSYAWGNPEEREVVLVNGQELQVPRNLEQFLRHLRVPDEGFQLWADAICINQEDVQEKTYQVGIMGEIFERCAAAYIWLGVPGVPSLDTPGSENSEINPFTLIHHFAQDHHITDLSCFENETTGNEITFVEDSEFNAIWAAFKDAFQKSWWSRYWCIQECLLPSSSTVMLGTWSVPWATIKRCEINYTRHTLSCCAVASGLMPKEYTFYADALVASTHFDSDSGTCVRPELSANLDRLLRTYQYKDCQDPRDKIYGILGLVDRSKYPTITVDYSLSCGGVYVNAMTSMLLDDGGKLRCLTGQGFNSCEHALPSWVRNFAARPDIGTANAEMTRFQSYELYDASRSSKAVPVLSSDNVLFLSGAYVDKIQRIGKPITRRSWDHIRDSLLDWFDVVGIDAADDQFRVRLSHPKERSFWCTLIADVFLENNQVCRRVSGNDMKDIEEWFTSMLKATKNGLDPFVSPCLRSLIFATYSRAVFRSDQGRIGLCYPSCQPGDEVWVLHGGNVPFILRPLLQKPSGYAVGTLDYRFIGEGYLHGVMDGEAMLNPCYPAEVALH